MTATVSDGVKINKTTVRVVKDDITDLEVDAFVFYAVEDLSRELNAAADSDAEERELQVLAAELVEQARTLSRSHARFTRNFRRDLADRAVASDQLLAAIDTYDRRYRTDLISMLELQDQLHQSLEPEEWREVAESLNQTAVRLDNRIMVSD